MQEQIANAITFKLSWKIPVDKWQTQISTRYNNKNKKPRNMSRQLRNKNTSSAIFASSWKPRWLCGNSWANKKTTFGLLLLLSTFLNCYETVQQTYDIKICSRKVHTREA